MTRLTTQEIEAIRKRASLATPGDWYSEVSTFENATEKLTEIAVQPGVAMQLRSEDDAEFIAHAREDIPKLLAEVDHLHDKIAFYLDELERKQKLYDDLARKFAISGGDA